MSEDVRYLDDARYDALRTEAARAGERDRPSEFPDLDTARAMLFREARLLDARRYERWLEMLSEDCLYWVPAAHEPADPRHEAAVNFDDRRRLVDRVTLIRTGYQHSQIPPTRTARLVGNIETWREPGGSLEVHSVLSLWAVRRAERTHYAGRQEHELVPAGDGWRIRRKVIRLLDCDQPLGNLSFIL